MRVMRHVREPWEPEPEKPNVVPRPWYKKPEVWLFAAIVGAIGVAFAVATHR